MSACQQAPASCPWTWKLCRGACRVFEAFQHWMRKSSSFFASCKDYMRRNILDAKLTTFRTLRPLVVTSHPLESFHLYQLGQAGYKEAHLPVFVLKQTASKSTIGPGFLSAIFSREQTFVLFSSSISHVHWNLLWVGFMPILFSGVKSRLQIILDTRRVSFSSHPWPLKCPTHWKWRVCHKRNVNLWFGTILRVDSRKSVSYTHLTLPTKLEV